MPVRSSRRRIDSRYSSRRKCVETAFPIENAEKDLSSESRPIKKIENSRRDSRLYPCHRRLRFHSRIFIVLQYAFHPRHVHVMRKRQMCNKTCQTIFIGMSFRLFISTSCNVWKSTGRIDIDSPTLYPSHDGFLFIAASSTVILA